MCNFYKIVIILHMQFRIFVFDKSNTSFFPGDFPGGSVVKNPPANAGDVGWIPGLGRSPGRGNGNPTSVFFLRNHMDREAVGHSP